MCGSARFEACSRESLALSQATVGLVLCVHSEATDPSIDIFDREAVFVEQTLRPLVRDTQINAASRLATIKVGFFRLQKREEKKTKRALRRRGNQVARFPTLKIVMEHCATRASDRIDRFGRGRSGQETLSDDVRTRCRELKHGSSRRELFSTLSRNNRITKYLEESVERNEDRVEF